MAYANCWAFNEKFAIFAMTLMKMSVWSYWHSHPHFKRHPHHLLALIWPLPICLHPPHQTIFKMLPLNLLFAFPWQFRDHFPVYYRTLYWLSNFYSHRWLNSNPQYWDFLPFCQIGQYLPLLHLLHIFHQRTRMFRIMYHMLES